MTEIEPIHPGEHLAEILTDLGITQYRLAKAMGVPQIRINDIVHCRRSITADTALRIGRALGMTPEFWLNLQRMYDLEVTRTTIDLSAITPLTEDVRHKTFVSYHHQDQEEADKFIRTFDHGGDVFIARAVGNDETMDELISSDNDDYVMQRIREDFLSDSTVTLLFIGKDTWSRKFQDWELAASLDQGPVAGKPNGVVAILSPELTEAMLPDRLADNLQSGYAKLYAYPKDWSQLAGWIEEAYQAREDEEKRKLVRNGRAKLKRNLSPSLPAGRASVKLVSDSSHVGQNTPGNSDQVVTGTTISISGLLDGYDR